MSSLKVRLEMLNLKLDKRKNRPVRQQLLDSLKSEINLHHFPSHAQLPQEDVFASRYEVSIQDVHWIYDQLLNEKLILRKEDDYYVSDFEIPSIFFNRVNSIIEIIKENKYDASFKDLLIETSETPRMLLESDPLLKGKCIHIQRQFMGDQKPLMLAHLYYPLNYFPGLDQLELQDREIWAILNKNYKVQPKGVQLLFEVKKIDKKQKHLLDTQFDFVHQVSSVIRDQNNQVLEYIIIYMRVDEMSFRFDIDLM